MATSSAEKLFIVGGTLLLLSVIASKAASRFGVPSLLFFLGIGMLAGSDGPGGFYFNDPEVVQSLGVLSLIFILFAGGLDTVWTSIVPVVRSGLSLSTLGVLITTGLVGWFASTFLGFSGLEGLLLGATVSSTDAAAVFTVLRERNLSLKGNITPLLEFESGSNDPMAVFLTVGILELITHKASSPFILIPKFFQQMVLGIFIGYVTGKIIISSINRLKLEFEGLYPVLTIAIVLLAYGISQQIGGNGFLSVYICGITLGNGNFLRKKTLILFHDGLAWLMQIVMFISLGLLVFPKQLLTVAPSGILLSLFLVLVARPISVHLSLLTSKFSFNDKMVLSWIGLRGAVPIVLATYPLLAHVEKARMIFNLVFFIVLTSVLLQGTTLQSVARWFKVDAPLKKKFNYPIEYVPTADLKNELIEMFVHASSQAIGKTLIDLQLPSGTLVVLIHRKENVIVPRGSTQIEINDTLLVLADRETLPKIKDTLGQKA